MRLREVAMEIGKTPSLLYITRSKNREKYDYMFGFDENKYTSLMLFKQHVQELQDNVGELLYEVSNKQLPKAIVPIVPSNVNPAELRKALSPITKLV